ncbi:MAG: hypothetical protein ACQEWV_12925 [Bacillota bacterium]
MRSRSGYSVKIADTPTYISSFISVGSFAVNQQHVMPSFFDSSIH